MATKNLSAENFEHIVNSNDIVLGKVDTEAEQALAAAAQISSIPTLMAFKNGTLAVSQPGALPAAALLDVITAVLDLDLEVALAEQQRSA